MGFPQDSVLPQGSLVLVTGVTGFLASNIADQLLLRGFRVRGTVRDLKSNKASWMPAQFEQQYGAGKFEMVEVKDIGDKGSLDTAIKECDGIIHVASPLGMESDPHKIIPPSISFLENAFLAAEKEPSVKRFVLTSSSAAVAQDRLNEVFDLTENMWADWAIKEAWAPPPYTMARARANYYASKALSEQKLWEYVEQRKPHFTANTVLPDFVLGLGINPAKQGYVSSMALFKQMFAFSGDDWRMFGPQWCVDVVDTALLHIAGLVCPQAENQRIYAYGHRKTWSDFVLRLERMYPGKSFPKPSKDEGEDLSNVIGRGKAEDLLKWMGQSGWRPLDESLREASEPLMHC